MESRNLLPNQMRLLGETENRPRENYGHSAAFINSVRYFYMKIYFLILLKRRFTGSCVSIPKTYKNADELSARY